jgi:hypothetical protein
MSWSRAEQSRAEQSRAEQSRAEQSRAEVSRAEIVVLLAVPLVVRSQSHQNVVEEELSACD